MQLIIGIIGSRRRNTINDFKKLYDSLLNLIIKIKEVKVVIITGDCDRGGDKFAREIATENEYKLIVKRIKDPETKKEMDFKNHRWFDYNTMCEIFYSRNEEIAKEPLDYLLALVTPDRKGGTENTIKYFKKYHNDWKKKLILI